MIQKRGGIDMSFGFIFSLILIIAIVGVAFYAITYFLDLGKSTEISLFYKEFQEEVDRAWNSEITKDRFIGALPGSIDAVCFGNLNTTYSGEFQEEFNALEDYFITDANMFLYPPENTNNQIYRTVDHVDLSELNGWHCFPVQNKQVAIPLEKNSFDSLVRITQS